MLVVRPGARFRQPPRVRPALSQPSGQRLPLPESGAAGRTLAADSAHCHAGCPRRAHRRRFTPTIDGEVTSYFEWLGAGQYRVDERSGSMHGKKFLVSEVLFGSDGESLFLRVDFRSGTEPQLPGMEARVTLQSLDNAPPQPVTIRLAAGAAASDDPVECAFLRILEARFPLAAAGVARGRAACVSSSRCGTGGSRWTRFRSRAGWRWPRPAPRRWRTRRRQRSCTTRSASRHGRVKL